MTDETPVTNRSNTDNCEELRETLIKKILDLELRIEKQSDEIDELRDELAEFNSEDSESL